MKLGEVEIELEGKGKRWDEEIEEKKIYKIGIVIVVYWEEKWVRMKRLK